MENKKFRPVYAVGKLRTEGEEYWLLSPQPVDADWEWFREMFRFAVVPKEPINKGKNVEPVYSYGRHLIVHPTNVSIEFINAFPIVIWDLGQVDLKSQALEVELEEYDPSPEDLEVLEDRRELDEQV